MTAVTNRKKVKRKKGFMDYAIWIDLPVNAAITGFVIAQIILITQKGIGAVLADFETMVQGTVLEIYLYAIPIIGASAVLALVIEVIYLILKLRGKETFITERYAIGFVIEKIFIIAFIIAAALIF